MKMFQFFCSLFSINKKIFILKTIFRITGSFCFLFFFNSRSLSVLIIFGSLAKHNISHAIDRKSTSSLAVLRVRVRYHTRFKLLLFTVYKSLIGDEKVECKKKKWFRNSFIWGNLCGPITMVRTHKSDDFRFFFFLLFICKFSLNKGCPIRPSGRICDSKCNDYNELYGLMKFPSN